MNFFCFKFWLVWRFIMGCLAHFNWLTALYMNCVYFSLWKFYDLLWFWMHLILCICFKPLRSENFVFIVFNLIIYKQKKGRNKTYKVFLVFFYILCFFYYDKKKFCRKFIIICIINVLQNQSAN